MRRIADWFVLLASAVLSVHVVAVIAADDMIKPPASYVGLAAGLLLLAAPLIATCNYRVAGKIDLWLSPALLPVTGSVAHLDGFTWAVVIIVSAVVAPGFYWRRSARRGYPAPLGAVSSWRTAPALFAGSGMFCALVMLSLCWSLGLRWFPLMDDCSSGPLRDERGLPRNIDFTARLIFIGPRTYMGYSMWSIARVEERFSGVAWRPPDLIVLRGAFKPQEKGERLFVEGRRSQGTVTRFLPMVQPSCSCDYTAPVGRAGLAIRVLRERSPRSGGRLIGHIYEGTRISRSRKPIPGARVEITGPGGATVATANAGGVYDANGFPPGQCAFCGGPGTIFEQRRDDRGRAARKRGLGRRCLC